MHTGEAILLMSETHKSSNLIKFLKILDNKYPENEKIRLIPDNHSAHTSKKTKKYLESKPGRFELVFTPKHGSWLNIIESFLSKMTRQMLREIRVASKDELAARIYQYFAEINEVPVVFHWRHKLEDITVDVKSGYLERSTGISLQKNGACIASLRKSNGDVHDEKSHRKVYYFLITVFVLLVILSGCDNKETSNIGYESGLCRCESEGAQ